VRDRSLNFEVEEALGGGCRVCSGTHQKDEGIKRKTKLHLLD